LPRHPSLVPPSTNPACPPARGLPAYRLRSCRDCIGSGGVCSSTTPACEQSAKPPRPPESQSDLALPKG
jgi:hypothetical protein